MNNPEFIGWPVPWNRPRIIGRKLVTRKTKKCALYGLLCAFLSVAVIPTQSGAQANCLHGTADQAKTMVERAVELVEQVGISNAFTAFMDLDGGFLKGNLYVFAIDFSGTILVNGLAPRSIGGNALAAKDSEGRFYVLEMIRIARQRGEGWVQYEFIDPCTGGPSPKSSFIKRVDEFLIGVGYYGAIIT